jgi:hypothetical protein
MAQHMEMNKNDHKDWYKNYTRHFIYHTGTNQLIFYNYFTVANNNTQNTRGVSMGVVNSSTLMRTLIFNTSAIYQKKYNK